MSSDNPSDQPAALAKVEAAALDQNASGRGFDLFLRLLLGSTEAESLAAFEVSDLAREASTAFAALATRVRGEPRITTRPSHLVPGGTVLEIVNDDMPFLLDSVLAEVQARDLSVALVLHPLFKVDRNGDGALTAVAAAADAAWGDGRQESYIAVHLAPAGVSGKNQSSPPMMSAPRQAELTAAIGVILGEVSHAVADWKPMLLRLRQAIEELQAAPAHVPRVLLDEQLAFLGWLADGNFTFLGARDYRLQGGAEHGVLITDDDAGLGLLRDPSVHVLRRGAELVSMTPEVRQFFFSPDPLIITKSNVVARVHRRVHMDYIGIKRYASDGQVAGELRFVGLFTSTAYTQSPHDIPVLRGKAAAMQERLALPPGSHAGKALANVLGTFPRDELFQISLDDLERWTHGILDLEMRPRTRVFLRYDNFDRFVSALVFVNRDRFNSGIRERIGECMAQRFGGYIAAYYPYFNASPLVRVHYIVARRSGALPTVPAADLERELAEITRTWVDALQAAIVASGPEGDKRAVGFATAFPAGYAEAFDAGRALEDIARVEKLSESHPLAIDIYREQGAPKNTVRAAIYNFDQPIRLSERVPVLENLGFTVIDERTFELAPRIAGRRRSVILHDMLLELPPRQAFETDGPTDLAIEETFVAVLSGAAENDSFNRLVMVANLTWRDAALLRSYAAYMRQLGLAYGPRYIAETLVRHPALVKALIGLFRLRFDPDLATSSETREAEAASMGAHIETALNDVASLDEDRILRQLMALIGATLRTNVFQRDADGARPQTIAFKFDSARLDFAPAPRPYREIFVASPRVEGVHLRFAPVARGGIRWSDRAQDYRTEVLGLARAQQVKNAVIVPSGAKGGFYPKALPRSGVREEIQAEGIAAYKIFIGAMLDLTDNIVGGAVAPPTRTVRHDCDDPYLVVAADKGTATFSDTANAIAIERKFWLGDAFASGGSAGYDHKALGITARGAWECVKRHFREMDRNIQVQPFTVVGVGDMSGDVFGNGMLLSPATRLVAAFDHRDIFLDPDPDPDRSYAERRRLFDTPRSSWDMYDRSCLSKGGGVYSRSAKSIALSPQIRAALNIEAEALPPNDLIRAILMADVDLLWFGGIGTYVRASTETDLDAGDRANDAIRVRAADLRVKVVGEGANLGITHRARIEAAAKGVRINTDFIDNSAGVNTSDQEVNIKIALGAALEAGRLTLADRNALLGRMTDDVATAVLRNNQQQSLALSLAERRHGRDLGPVIRLIRDLEQRGLVNRRLEALPGDHEFEQRAHLGQGLTRPELAVILSFTKIAILHDLVATPTGEDASLADVLSGYFPETMREPYASEIAAHRLGREIVATTLTNSLVNRLGPAMPLALADAAGRPVTATVPAFIAARAVLDLQSLWQQIDALDGRISGALQLDLYEHTTRALIVATSDFLRLPLDMSTLSQTIDRFARGSNVIGAALDAVASPGAMASIRTQREALVGQGVTEPLADALSRLDALIEVPAIVMTAERAERDVVQTATMHFVLASILHIDAIAERGRALSPDDDYERLAVSGAMTGLREAHQRLVQAGLAAIPGAGPAEVEAWLSSLGAVCRRARDDLGTISGAKVMTAPRLSVAVTRLASLAEAADASNRSPAPLAPSPSGLMQILP